MVTVTVTASAVATRHRLTRATDRTARDTIPAGQLKISGHQSTAPKSLQFRPFAQTSRAPYRQASVLGEFARRRRRLTRCWLRTGPSCVCCMRLHQVFRSPPTPAAARDEVTGARLLRRCRYGWLARAPARLHRPHSGPGHQNYAKINTDARLFDGLCES